MSDGFQYEWIQGVFDTSGARAGIDALLERLQSGDNPHAVFRLRLLKKRRELGLPLLNPGDLSGYPVHVRKAYEAFVEEACRDAGNVYLKQGRIIEAWRYLRTISDKDAMRAALEKLNPADATDDVLNIALDEGVHPGRGFELVLERDGICRAITLFEASRSLELSVRRHCAGLLAAKLYVELVTGVSKQIFERFGEIPPETDLVELIRHRPWLFENANSHADPSHISAVSRIGLMSDAEPNLLMSLSISEYGRKLDMRHAAATEAPFEAGFEDHARYARAILGENADATLSYFVEKLVGYDTVGAEAIATEWIVALAWRVGQRKRALELWLQYLGEQLPEVAGVYIPSFYDMCVEAREFGILADMAKKQGDLTAWGAACALGAREPDGAAAANTAPANPEHPDESLS